MTKLCVDCKWWDGKLIAPECVSPANGIDLATGDPKTRYCRTSRLFGPPLSWLFGDCGKTGRFWEASDEA